MWVYELIRLSTPISHHVSVEREHREIVGDRCVGGDHGGVEVDIGGDEAVEDGAGMGDVGERENCVSDELEGEELGLAMAESDDVGLELVEMVDVFAVL